MTARFSQARSMGPMPAHGGVEPSVRVWYNPDLTNTRFNALAMIAQGGFMLAVLLPAATMVRERENGTLDQIRVTPIRAHELFLGKIIPPVTVTLASLLPSLMVVRVMGVPMNGSLATLMALDLLFLLSAVSIGIFIGSIARTLQQALLSSFFSLIPLLFLSGSVSPIESMPRWLQVAMVASPLRHGVEIISGLFLKGAGMGELWPHAAALAAIGLPLTAGAWLIFRRSW
jgi:ABC-2 type transport system permease protein